MSARAGRYSDLVRARFQALTEAGDLPPAAGQAVSGEGMALDRLAWVRFTARIDGGRVADCRFRAFGCPHTLAAASLVAERLRGSALDALPTPDIAGLARELEAPAEKRGRLLVVEDAWRDLLACARRVQ